MERDSRTSESVTDSSTDRRSGSKPARWIATAIVAALALTLLVTISEAAGPAVRRAALIETVVSSEGTEPSFDDASEEVAAFLNARDSIRLVVPWSMTVEDLLSLYHLENNASARAALLDQLGAAEPDDVIQEGATLSFALTPARATP